MTSTVIDAAGICRIIREAARAGVHRIEILNTLTLEFGPERYWDPRNNFNYQLASARKPRQTDDTNPEPPKILLTKEDEEAFKAMEELQLAIDDPLAYERAQIGEDVEIARLRGADAEETFDSGTQQTLYTSE